MSKKTSPVENKQTIEASNSTSNEILELKKELAENIANKLDVSKPFKSFIVDYLVEEGDENIVGLKDLEGIKDYMGDKAIENIFGGLGLITPQLMKFREEINKQTTKKGLEELKAKILKEIGGTEQLSTSDQESGTSSENPDESSGKAEEDAKEETTDNNGKDGQTSDSKEEATNSIVEKACKVAVDIANDNSYGYEWGGTGDKNGKKGFDCQGFVRYCYREIGINVPPSGGCGNMKRDFEKAGFECIAFNKNEKLKPGDILLDPKKHTEMCISENKIAGAHSNKDGKSGDSGGEEISIRDVKKSISYWHPQYILRYKG